MQPAGKNILPIFNKKKRPRQAVFTYPQKATEPTNVTGGGPSQSFQPANTQKQSQAPGYMQFKPQQQTSGQYNRAPGFSNNSNRNTPSSVVNNNRSSFAAQPPGACGSASQPGFLGQPSHKGREPPMKHAPMKRQQQKYQPPQPQPQPQQYRPQQQLNQIRSNPPQYSGDNNGKENHQQYRSTHQQSNQFNKSSHVASTYPNPATNKRPYTPSSATQSRPPTGSGASTSTSQQFTPRNMQMASSTSTPAVFIPFKGPGTSGKEEAPPATPAAVDKTLKILTSSIEGMKHWSQFTDFVGLLLFEMFGILNSAITMGESDTTKLFSLKDGTHTQKCIFYETDRKIPRLTRGQCLRCVGSLNKKSGLFRVVSVRPASQQEQKMSKAIIAKCDQAIGDKLAEMQEQ